MNRKEPLAQLNIKKDKSQPHLNINPLRQEPPQPLSRDSHARTLDRPRRLRLQLSTVQVEKGKPRSLASPIGPTVNAGLVADALGQACRQQALQRRQRPVQRQTPASAAGLQIAIALKDAEGHAFTFEVLCEQQTADAGANDEDGRLAGAAASGRSADGHLCVGMQQSFWLSFFPIFWAFFLSFFFCFALLASIPPNSP